MTFQATDSPANTLPSASEVLGWLRALPAAKRTPKPCRLADDVEDGSLTISTYARGWGLAFHGTYDFIQRWFNWAINTGVVGPGAQLNWYARGHVGDVAYVCPPTRRHILRGLAIQFRWEIILSREVPPLVDRVIDEETGEREVVWNNRIINSLAVARARQFYQDNIQIDGILLQRMSEPASIYHLSMGGREMGSWNTEAEA